MATMLASATAAVFGNATSSLPISDEAHQRLEALLGEMAFISPSRLYEPVDSGVHLDHQRTKDVPGDSSKKVSPRPLHVLVHRRRTAYGATQGANMIPFTSIIRCSVSSASAI